jgi:exopolysaccharide biosynthesis protein
MRALGAWQALNFDGGGSTTMVIGGAVVNVPSDSTGERAVGDALLVVRSP